jgi:uncharacterized membrane protein YhaH (DUF805 family)
MTTDESNRRPLRLWPGVVAVVLQWLVWLGLPVVVPGAGAPAAMGGLLGGLLVTVWWAFFSRAPRSERWGAVVLVIVALIATSRVVHESIATAGMGWLFYIYAVPGVSLAFVVWAVAGRRLRGAARRATMVAAVLLACSVWMFLQTHGISGEGESDFAWRWAKTPEELLLAQASDEPMVLAAVSEQADREADVEAEWPGFRGPARDSVLPGVRIETDWSASPPVELWRRPIGPGWSSFAVEGELFYTQEQRGEDELVSCYSASTGEPVWRHRDAVRFWESNAGPGPRATPTLSGGRVYTFGGTGILNALAAEDGARVWSRDVVVDTGAEVPEWGFSSSPLVAQDVVIVAAAGQLVAYDLASGELRWMGAADDGYSSPHHVTLDGVAQVVLLGGAGAQSVAPGTGALLWDYPWPGAPIVQPALTADGELLISTAGPSGAVGIRRLAVSQGEGGWAVEERWRSSGLKPYFNDFVVHEGHAYGFDKSILACIDVETGERVWKGGRYGHGQLILLADQDLLLLVSEQGELVLVAATPDSFAELARSPALEGKTWNHPVLRRDLLLVRNAEEMAAFRLSLADG